MKIFLEIYFKDNFQKKSKNGHKSDINVTFMSNYAILQKIKSILKSPENFPFSKNYFLFFENIFRNLFQRKLLEKKQERT